MRRREKFYCGVGLQGHADMETVDIHACHHRLFGIDGCFFVDDAGQGAHFHGRETYGLGLSGALAFPKAPVLGLQAVHEGG